VGLLEQGVIMKTPSATWCSSCHCNFFNGVKGVTRFQAVCRREILHFIVRTDEELKGKVLDVFFGSSMAPATPL